MALSSPIKAIAERPASTQRIAEASVLSQWVDAVTVGGMVVQDASGTVTDPDSDITSSTRRKVRCDEGKFLIARMGYDDGDTPGVSPVAEFWGRTELYDASGTLLSADEWMLLEDSVGNRSFTLAPSASTDASDGTDNYTVPTPLIDRKGCNTILVAIKTVYTVSVGSAALARLQIKVL